MHTDFITIKGNVLLEFCNVITGKVRRYKIDNLAVTVGKNAIAARLAGSTATNKGSITYCAVGIGTTAAAASDTILASELYRKLISVRSSENKTAILKTFFNTTEANGTLQELGLFGDDATGTANTGTLYARTLTTRTKSQAETLTITWQFTLQ